MTYTQWLVNRFPQLNQVSSATTFALINQARQRTKTLRILISLLSYLVGGILVAIGFTALVQHGGLLSYFAGAVVVLVFFGLLSKTEQRLSAMVIKKSLLKQMATNTSLS
ncbi:hypothetical protein [Shewanella waksmanii]|uniref:hypothetical protein n=1 Tax=Shewanella waksmanii TaxID=213783 RepID=UPI00048B4ACE|nr:hypothetical protein [Shewanella waksmanii]